VTRRRSLRSQLYRAARDLGDLQAIEKGPTAYAKRRVRKVAYREVNVENHRVPIRRAVVTSWSQDV